jgi:hypothetical protein
VRQSNFKCDSCGKVSQSGGGLPSRWLQVDYWHKDQRHTYHLCSYSCLISWAEEKQRFLAERSDYMITAFDKEDR